jgi:riboflavin synthase
VNLERAMQLGGRFGGHIVSGHIDATGKILGIREDDNAVWYRIGADYKTLKYIVEKGSVALDGISLTVAEVRSDSFSVSVIPHTRANTTLTYKKIGDIINIETDCIGKYVEKLVPGHGSGVSREVLLRNGFI